MAVKVNPTGAEKKLFTGVATCNVIAVNPSKAELELLGIKTEKEQVYLSVDKEDKVTKQLRVSFLCEFKVGTVTHRTGLSIFLKDKQRTDMFINKTGNFGKDVDKVGGETHNPYEGEIELVNFVATLCNSKKGDDISLETIAGMLLNGNVKELKDIVKNAKANTVKLLLGVSADGKYQHVYTRKIERGYSTDFSYLHKDLVKNQQWVKDDFGPIDLVVYNPANFRLREWTGEAAMQSEQTHNTNSNGQAKAQDTQETPDAPDAPDASTDDLPF